MALKPTDNSIQSLWTTAILGSVILFSLAYFFAPEGFNRFFQSFLEVEITSGSYEHLLSLSNNPSVKPSIEAAMSDGFISVLEYRQILELSSPKTLLVLQLEAK
ncbi:hypothetical protein V4D10_00745 [Vibrio mimicus]|uniref:hypothetical protein n=1 Tax=Vibrio mimicus TaxID=674 RepID=UPI002F930D9D